jgi:hypothetical protein
MSGILSSLAGMATTAAGSSAAALSNGAGKGIEEAVKKEVCELIREDKAQITNAVISAIKEQISENKEISKPIIEEIKNIITRDMSGNVQSTEPTPVIPLTEVSNPSNSNTLDQTVGPNAPVIKDESGDKESVKLAPTIAPVAAAGAGAAAVLASGTLDNATDALSGAKDSALGALSGAKDSALGALSGAKDSALGALSGAKDIASNAASAKDALSGGLSSMGTSALTSGMGSSILGALTKGGNKKKRTSKRPRYGSRCKTLFYKNGGRRRKTRRSRK